MQTAKNAESGSLRALRFNKGAVVRYVRRRSSFDFLFGRNRPFRVHTASMVAFSENWRRGLQAARRLAWVACASEESLVIFDSLNDVTALGEDCGPQFTQVSAGRKRKYRRRRGVGRKPISPRDIFAAVVYVLRTGCQWKALPKAFGSASSIHNHFRQWRHQGVFVRLWRAGLAEYDEMEGIAWEWQSLDGTQGKAPLAGPALD